MRYKPQAQIRQEAEDRKNSEQTAVAFFTMVAILAIFGLILKYFS